MNEFLDQMGRRITARPKELGLTQEKLSEIVNLSAQTLSTADCGKKALCPENIVKLSATLICSTDYLLMGTEAPIAPEKLNRVLKTQHRCSTSVLIALLIIFCWL